jgi:sugar lactone lactonase YvrE
VTVYAARATGNVLPIQQISGSKTGLNIPTGIALDASRNIYVANFVYPGSVTIYAAGANGNVTPIRTIAGSNTGLNRPDGIALDANANIYVANNPYGIALGGDGFRSSLTVYAAGANGNVAPIRTIVGRTTRLHQPTGVAIR